MYVRCTLCALFFFLNVPPPPEIYPFPLHNPLPIYVHPLGNPHFSLDPGLAPIITQNIVDGLSRLSSDDRPAFEKNRQAFLERSEEHTSELQSPCNLVCRLLLEKTKTTCDRHATILT